MNKLSQEIDAMLDEFRDKNDGEDTRITDISDEDFMKSVKEAEARLNKEFQDIDERRAKAFQQAINEGIILI